MSPEALDFWNAMRSAPQQISLPLEKRREAGEHAEDATSEPAGVGYQPAAEVGGLWAIPENARPDLGILYLFGGGYVLGSPASRRKTAGHLAVAAGVRVLVPNYRLAPEHRFPSAVVDALAAYDFMLSGGVERVVIVGDSAGGGLALACGLALRDRGKTVPAGIAALSPWADLTCSGESMSENATNDIECTRTGLLDMAHAYLGDHDPRDPLASPVFGKWDGMPPIFCIVGSDETLLDDSVRVVRAAGLARCDARLDIVAGMQHVFPIWCGAFPEAGREMARLGDWVRDLLPGGM
jgi:monoterpene epsilon-lactone hydrolase